MSKSSEKVTESDSGADLWIDRAKRVFSVSDDKDLATLLGMRPNTLANRKSRSSIPYRALIRLAESHHVSLDKLFGVEQSDSIHELIGLEREVYATGERRPPPSGRTIDRGIILIPRFEAGESAGVRTISDEVIVETLAVSEDFIRANRLCADRVVTIQVCDGSMVPTLEQGDQVIVDRSIERIAGDGVYAIRHAGVLKIKRLQMRGDGSLLMLSDNPSYRPEVIAASQIAASLVVIGRVLPYKFGRIRL